MSEGPSERGIDIDAKGVMKMIPHRYPFLMIDRVENAVADKGCVGIKNVSMNEAIFQGHFPSDPVMPGVLIIEAMAQTAAVLVVHTLGAAFHGKLVYFMSIDNARFRRPVVPGDRLVLKATLERAIRGIWKFETAAEVDGTVAASATMMVAPEVKP
jgi:3-hydroxyacyl-[acyl-carrier-protein] dehydratase